MKGEEIHMKIKLTTFYALKAIHNIYRADEEIVTSNKIAREEKISQGVVLRILRILASEGVLRAHQGRGAVSGGFSLSQDINKITLLKIIDMLEGVSICKNLTEEVCQNSEGLHEKFSHINENIRKELSKYTILDLFENNALA